MEGTYLIGKVSTFRSSIKVDTSDEQNQEKLKTKQQDKVVSNQSLKNYVSRIRTH